MRQPKGAPAGRGSERWRIAAAALIVASIAFLAFRHTLGHEFVSWDDDVYVYENPALVKLSAEGTWALATSFYYFAYIPVTMLSHAFDVLLWGMNPRGHHLTNVLLHAANALWVLILGTALLRLSSRRVAPPSRGRWAALLGMGIAAILFAVHPLRAESVSWVSDRKDLLCTFFALPGVIAYVVHSARGDATPGRRWLVASFFLFVLAVLSKSTAVGLPIVLLLLDWLGGRRGGAILREKVPFFIVSAAVAAISMILSPHERPSYSVSHLTGLDALLFPFYSLSFPLFKTLAPLGLGPLYPRVGLEWMIAGLLAVTAITAAAAVLAKRGRKGMLVAWLVYLVLLAPNIAGLGSGMQPVADRYSYLSTLSLYLLLGAATSAVWERGGKRRLAVAVCGAALAVIFVLQTVPQAARWRSSIALWEFVVSNFPARRDYTDAYVNLGAAYAQAGRRAEASAVLDKALVLDPANPKALYNLGVISYFEGRLEKALACFRRASEVDPHPATAYFNRALVSEELGFHDEAFDSMVRAARLGSKDAQEALTSRGVRW